MSVLAIVGSRTFDDYDLLVKEVDKLASKTKITRIVSGGASGADTLAEHYARTNDISLCVYPADWKKYGKRAGFLRNHKIIEECDICLAFWDGNSKGTKHSIDLARDTHKKTYVVYF